MPVSPIPYHIYNDVLLKLLPVIDSHPENLANKLRLVAVHVYNRRPDRFGDLRAIQPCPRVGRHRREPDLIVNHNVHVSPGGVALEVLHLQVLINNALAGEGGVPVQQHAEAPKITNLKLLVALLVVQEVLNGPSFAVDERVNGLQVRGVGQHGEADFFAVGVLLVVSGAEVVFDVAGVAPDALVGFHGLQVLKLRENLLVRLVQHVRQRAQPAPVGHAENDVLEVALDGLVHEGAEPADHGVVALDAEPLARAEALREELAEAVLPAEPAEGSFLFINREGLGAELHHFVLDPVDGVFVLDVAVFDS
jgi:hypothetical protein